MGARGEGELFTFLIGTPLRSEVRIRPTVNKHARVYINPSLSVCAYTAHFFFNFLSILILLPTTPLCVFPVATMATTLAHPPTPLDQLPPNLCHTILDSCFEGFFGGPASIIMGFRKTLPRSQALAPVSRTSSSSTGGKSAHDKRPLDMPHPTGNTVKKAKYVSNDQVDSSQESSDDSGESGDNDDDEDDDDDDEDDEALVRGSTYDAYMEGRMASKTLHNLATKPSGKTIPQTYAASSVKLETIIPAPPKHLPTASAPRFIKPERKFQRGDSVQPVAAVQHQELIVLDEPLPRQRAFQPTPDFLRRLSLDNEGLKVCLSMDISQLNCSRGETKARMSDANVNTLVDMAVRGFDFVMSTYSTMTTFPGKKRPATPEEFGVNMFSGKSGGKFGPYEAYFEATRARVLSPLAKTDALVIWRVCRILESIDTSDADDPVTKTYDIPDAVSYMRKTLQTAAFAAGGRSQPTANWTMKYPKLVPLLNYAMIYIELVAHGNIRGREVEILKTGIASQRSITADVVLYRSEVKKIGIPALKEEWLAVSPKLPECSFSSLPILNCNNKGLIRPYLDVIFKLMREIASSWRSVYLKADEEQARSKVLQVVTQKPETDF